LRRTVHRLVGYFEEEAVLSYTRYKKEIDAGRSPNLAAPAIARRHLKLVDDTTLRDPCRVNTGTGRATGPNSAAPGGDAHSSPRTA
jgi:hypothetical protein